MTPGSTAERGFTLVEVLVALAIFAVLAVAVGTASRHVLLQTQQVRDRLLASWVADNHLTQLLLQPPMSAGQRRLEVDFAQRRWILDEVRKTRKDAGMLEIRLRVALMPEGSVLGETTHWLEVEHVAE
ncbi:type II secretion system minor pseudopilin GspI [Pseudomonas sp. Teo4]|uniref:type II secretion system minor pseudopilin GspI n=1 Tax=Pseudomonas sp. Teo4 TaxID=3064528 RepID=UPI002ABB1E46|nr:type II secretion system minor pseudopilin GspI [Pseudomonas sp. Teo4]MDZ3994218.1 hypothetical protein [Pseudomonas sp. Teo4]